MRVVFKGTCAGQGCGIMVKMVELLSVVLDKESNVDLRGKSCKLLCLVPVFEEALELGFLQKAQPTPSFLP